MGYENCGRKTAIEENIKTIEVQIANITTEALIDLAKKKVFNQIRMLGNSKKSLKSTVALALPVLLKSIKDKKEISVMEVKPLLSAIRGEVIQEPKLIDETTSEHINALKALQEIETAQEPKHSTQEPKEPVTQE